MDHESIRVYHRFSEVFEFYNSLVKLEIITDANDLVFPSKGSGLESGIYDPESLFIQKRRIDLQVFMEFRHSC